MFSHLVVIFLTLSGPFGGLVDHSYRLMPPAAHSIGFPFGKLLGSLPSRYMADTHGFGLSQDITLGSLHLARVTLQRRIGQKHDTIGAWSRIVYKLYNPVRHSSATSAFRVQNSYSSLLTFQPSSNNPPLQLQHAVHFHQALRRCCFCCFSRHCPSRHRNRGCSSTILPLHTIRLAY